MAKSKTFEQYALMRSCISQMLLAQGAELRKMCACTQCCDLASVLPTFCPSRGVDPAEKPFFCRM